MWTEPGWTSNLDLVQSPALALVDSFSINHDSMEITTSVLS